MKNKPYILFSTILLLTLSYFIIGTSPISAVCCATDAECTAPGEVCRYQSADAQQCAFNSPSTPGWCEAPDPLDPDFTLPVYGNLTDGINFNFNRLTGRLTDVGDVLSEATPYIFTIAGLLLFFYLIYGSITLIAGRGEPESLAAGNTIITHALIGFSIIFIAYWLIQVLELIFDLNIFRG